MVRGLFKFCEESQLLAEEKWIIRALTILKQQRNSLQIERLHLENLRATINKEDLRKLITSDNAINTHKPDEATSSVPSEEQITSAVLPDLEISSTSLSQFDVPTAGIDEEMCNNEELYLAVTNSGFGIQESEVFDAEEDEEDMENCEIDMNMFMYGK